MTIMRENAIIKALCLRKEKVDYLTKKKNFKWFVYRAHFRDNISNQSAGSSQIEKKEY